MRWRVFLACGFLSLLSACQNSADNPLAGDQASLVKCPANGCSNGVANASEMSITYSGPSPILTNAGDQTVVLGGDCYPSTYPDNRIDVNITYATGAAISPQAASPDFLSASTIKCEKGRYNISLDLNGLPAGNSYRVILTEVGLDGTTQYRGYNDARFSISR
jgi:hypothetical protein